MRKIALAVPCPELGCTAPVALQRLQCTTCVGCVGTCRLCAIEKKAARHIRVAVSTIYQAKHVDHIHKLLVSLSFYLMFDPCGSFWYLTCSADGLMRHYHLHQWHLSGLSQKERQQDGKAQIFATATQKRL